MSKRRLLGVQTVVRLGLACAITACTSVDMVRLTSQQFPAKTSDTEVDVLEREPARAHIPLAALRVKSSVSSFEAMQRKILKKAAALGADAVVFAKPQSQVRHEAAYDWGPYSPWGFDSPYYYGSWMGYGVPCGWGCYSADPMMAYGVPDEIVNSLQGTAIRYTRSGS